MTGMLKDFSHLLIVEDDQGIRQNLKDYLSKKGYCCSTAMNAEHALRLMDVLKFDLLLVDVLMPGMNGRGLVRKVRKDGNTVPIIIMTALSELDDVIKGFDAGTDGYMTKPIEPSELVARIEALLRRVRSSDSELPGITEITFGGHRFDIRRDELWRDGNLIPITEMEARILRRLAQTPNEPVDRDELTDTSRVEDKFSQNRAVDVRVSRLRQKIEGDGRPRHLVTVRGKGYKIITD